MPGVYGGNLSIDSDRVQVIVVRTNARDPRFFELFSAAVRTGLKYVALAETGKTHIGTHTPWPELTLQDNGLPYVSNKTYDCPKKYSDAIDGMWSALFTAIVGSDEQALDFSKEPEFLALTEYVKTNSRLSTYFIHHKDREFGDIRLRTIVGEVLDRYIHMNNTFDLDRDKLLAVYLPIENYLFEETLPFLVVVPILSLKFDLREFRINEVAWVEELSDDIHLARGWQGPYSHSDNDLIESAATHALFISGLHFENKDWVSLGQLQMQPESFPIEMIDTFFAALRISMGYITGYAQLLALPVGWASGYTANLTPLDRLTANSYPPLIEAWREEIPVVDSIEVDLIRECFKNLRHAFGTSHSRKVRLAMHRLNLSAMRTTEEDGVIDAMIAMEALLSDGPQEMTHKIAMRVAALYKIFDPERSEQVFKEMKRIYLFRSKIVHGDSDLDKFREIDRDGGKVTAVNAAVEHLRIAFWMLIKNPSLLEPAKIDSFLLTDKLQSPGI